MHRLFDSFDANIQKAIEREEKAKPFADKTNTFARGKIDVKRSLSANTSPTSTKAKPTIAKSFSANPTPNAGVQPKEFSKEQLDQAFAKINQPIQPIVPLFERRPVQQVPDSVLRKSRAMEMEYTTKPSMQNKPVVEQPMVQAYQQPPVAKRELFKPTTLVQPTQFIQETRPSTLLSSFDSNSTTVDAAAADFMELEDGVADASNNKKEYASSIGSKEVTDDLEDVDDESIVFSDIPSLLLKANSKDWLDRKACFSVLTRMFYSDKHSDVAAYFDKIMAVYLERLTDTHYRVVSHVLLSLCKMIPLFQMQVESHLEKYVRLIELNLVDFMEGSFPSFLMPRTKFASMHQMPLLFLVKTLQVTLYYLYCSR